MTIEQIKKVVAPVCRQLDVKRLDLFGSVARGEGDTESDVDLLVEFAPPDSLLHRRFFGLLHQLEDVLGRKVDLLTFKGLRNPYFRRRVLQERVNIYEG
jgi:predicted nucleotidyltransferase